MNDTKSLKDVNLENPEDKRNYNRTLFDTVAPAYDRITMILSFGQDQKWKQKLIETMPQVSNPVCLDLACGTADITKSLSSIYPSGKIIGLDLNEKMIQQAKLDTTHSNINFEIGDMCDLKQADESIDIVTGGYALRNAPDLSVVLREIFRVMKPGAFGSFLDFSKPRNMVLAKLEYLILLFWGNIWGLLVHGKPEVYGYIAESLIRFPDRNSLSGILSASGFEKITSKTFMFGFCALTTFKKPS